MRPGPVSCIVGRAPPCQLTGVGNPYPSRVAALAARMPVDYPGRCAPLPAGCHGVQPWGTCCPVCAAYFTPPKVLDRAMLAVNKLPRPWPHPHRTLSLQAMLIQLQRQVRSTISTSSRRDSQR